MRKSYHRKFECLLSLLILLLIIQPSNALGQGTAFSYQGRLTSSGNPADGVFDMQFRLFDSADVGTGSQQGSTVEISSVQVTAGIFTVQLDFGAAAFPGADRYLEISVRPTGGGAFTMLTPRQAVTSTPYAVRSTTAGTADTATNATQLGGQPATGFIQNSTTQQAATDFNISGNGTLGGTLSAGAVNAATHYNIAGLKVLNVTGLFDDGSLMLSASNTFVGESAGMNTTPSPTPASVPGKFNSFFGQSSGVLNTTGFGNAFFGALAGNANTIGTQNTIIGSEADVGANNLQNATAIGARALVSQSNSLVLGSVSGINDATATVNVGIGTIAPTERLHVAGNGLFTGNLTVSGTLNTASVSIAGLRTEANATSPNVIGGFSGNTVTAGVVGATIGGGGEALNSFLNRITDNYGTIGGGRNNQAGDNAGTTSDKQFATVGGGTGNIASGPSSTIGGGIVNISSGDSATVGGGFSNDATENSATVSGGLFNTASARAAAIGGGESNGASGISSTVPGGIANTAAGDFSFAAGRRAKANHQGAFVWADSTNADFVSTANDQFLIRAAGGVGITGNLTVLRDTSDPATPVAIFGSAGTQTPLAFRSGATETARIRSDSVGNLVLATIGGTSKNIFFRAGDDSNTDMFIQSSTGNVGIGTNTPSARLTVSGAGDFDAAGAARFDLISTVANSTFLQHVTDAGAWQLADGSATRMLVNAAGNVGIGTTTPADLLHVAGDTRVGTGTTGCVKDANGTVIAGACSSDARLKHSITPFPATLDKLIRLRPVHFYWRAKDYPERSFGDARSFGLIAQEVEGVLPELVTEDAGGYKAVNYSKLPMMLLQAIKELKEENDSLKQELHQMKLLRKEFVTLKRLVCQGHLNTKRCN